MTWLYIDESLFMPRVICYLTDTQLSLFIILFQYIFCIQFFCYYIVFVFWQTDARYQSNTISYDDEMTVQYTISNKFWFRHMIKRAVNEDG